MTLFQIAPIQLEVLRRPPAFVVVPSVGEQNTADIHENAVIEELFSIMLLRRSGADQRDVQTYSQPGSIKNLSKTCWSLASLIRF